MLFLVMGVVGIVASVLRLNGSVLHRCPQCTGLYQASIIFCAIFVVLGVLGFIATEMRSRCQLCLYKLILFLLMLIVSAFLVLTWLLKDGHFDTFLSSGWQTAVADNGDAVCEFEATFYCSGWEKPCPQFTVLNATIECPKCNPKIFPEAKLPAQSCKELISNKVSDNFKAMMIAGVVAWVVLFFTNFVAFRNGQQWNYIFDDYETGYDPPTLQQQQQQERKAERKALVQKGGRRSPVQAVYVRANGPSAK